MSNILKTLRSLIRRVDAFGSPVTFNIDGKASYQSAIGGIMTLLMVSFVVLFFQSQIKNFFNRTRISLDYSQEFSADPPLINLDHNKFMFVLAIEQPDQYPYNERPFYTITVTQSFYKRSSVPGMQEERKFINVSLKPCSIEDFTQYELDNIQKVYDNFNFETFLCPDKSFSLKLQGAYLSSEFSFVKISVDRCVNQTKKSKIWNYTCAPQSAIDEYLATKGSHRILFYSTNYVINPDNTVDFSQLYMAEDLNFQFQPGYILKNVNVFLRTYEVITDQSLFIDQDLQNSTFVFRGERSFQDETIVDHSTDVPKPPITIYIRSDYFTFGVDRRFQKIDELLSYFGGIFQLFILVIGLGMKYYNERFFMLRLANKIYDFKEQKQHHFKKQKNVDVIKLSSIINSVNPKQNKYKEAHKPIEPQLADVIDLDKIRGLGFKTRNEFLITYFERILSQRLKLKASLSYILYYLSCKRVMANNRNRLIDKAVDQSYKDMNIRNMMDQIVQIDKMKRLLLNSDQIILFNFFPKPEISLKQSHVVKFNSLDSDEESFDQGQNDQRVRQTSVQSKQKISNRLDYLSYQKLLDAYDKLVKTQSTDETTNQINEKLIHLLGEEIRTVFSASLMMQEIEFQEEQAKILRSQVIDPKGEDKLQSMKDNYKKTLIIHQAAVEGQKINGSINGNPSGPKA